jgi:hypothetical protein
MLPQIFQKAKAQGAPCWGTARRILGFYWFLSAWFCDGLFTFLQVYLNVVWLPEVDTQKNHATTEK